ncbi:MAG: hypothetical protein ACKVYV_10170 [Limisphaerales bacterium]
MTRFRPARLAGAAGLVAGVVLPALRAGEADRWLHPPGIFPEGTPAARLTTNEAAGLSGTAAQGRLRVTWPPPAPPANAAVRLRHSTDAPGHWPARHWRTLPMTWRDGAWHADVPVVMLEAPVIYFAETTDGANDTKAQATPMRIFFPAQAGLTRPANLRWAFLEGFEEGHEGWALATGATNALPLETVSPGASGRHALAVAVPPGRASVAVTTTALRGWMLLEHGAAALRLSARTDAGEGRLRVKLLANAGSPEFVLHEGPPAETVGPAWRRVEIPLAAYPRLRVRDVDRLVIEFAGRAGQRLLVDDVELVPP